MDQARVLIRSVVRAFYETEHVVLIDALVTHSALSLADLAFVLDLGKQTKAVQKLCGRLKEDGLLSVYPRQETREGSLKAVTKEYYFIDYRRAVDAIKYRYHRLDTITKASAKPTAEKKDFFCPRCKSQWSTMEVLDLVDPQGRGAGFICRECEGVLESKQEPKEGGPGGEGEDAEIAEGDTLAIFNRQFRPFENLLRKVDEVVVPAMTGELALAEALPVPRDEKTHPGYRGNTMDQPAVRPTAVKGMTTGPAQLEINLTSDAETNAAAQLAEAERKAKVAAQNQLPAWHTTSTVSGEATGKGTVDNGLSNGGGTDITPNVTTPKAEDDDDDEKKMADASLDEYFAALKAEQERQAREKAEEDEEDDEEEDDDDDDDDDEEFEDVPTPLPMAGTQESTAATNGTVKQEPADEPDAKRARLDGSSGKADVETPVGEESDEDDFEDAL